MFLGINSQGKFLWERKSVDNTSIRNGITHRLVDLIVSCSISWNSLLRLFCTNLNLLIRSTTIGLASSGIVYQQYKVYFTLWHQMSTSIWQLATCHNEILRSISYKRLPNRQVVPGIEQGTVSKLKERLVNHFSSRTTTWSKYFAYKCYLLSYLEDFLSII